MKNGEKDNRITILISKSPKNYSDSFINNLLDKRNEIICKIVKRILLEGTIWGRKHVYVYGCAWVRGLYARTQRPYNMLGSNFKERRFYEDIKHRYNRVWLECI